MYGLTCQHSDVMYDHPVGVRDNRHHRNAGAVRMGDDGAELPSQARREPSEAAGHISASRVRGAGQAGDPSGPRG